MIASALMPPVAEGGPAFEAGGTDGTGTERPLPRGYLPGYAGLVPRVGGRGADAITVFQLKARHEIGGRTYPEPTPAAERLDPALRIPNNEGWLRIDPKEGA